MQETLRRITVARPPSLEELGDFDPGRVEGRSAVGARADVVAGGKGPTSARQDDGPDIGISVAGVQGLVKLGGHLRVDGVEGLRPVQGDREDRLRLLVEDHLVGHRDTSLSDAGRLPCHARSTSSCTATTSRPSSGTRSERINVESAEPLTLGLAGWAAATLASEAWPACG